MVMSCDVNEYYTPLPVIHAGKKKKANYLMERVVTYNAKTSRSRFWEENQFIYYLMKSDQKCIQYAFVVLLWYYSVTDYTISIFPVNSNTKIFCVVTRIGCFIGIGVA